MTEFQFDPDQSRMMDLIATKMKIMPDDKKRRQALSVAKFILLIMALIALLIFAWSYIR